MRKWFTIIVLSFFVQVLFAQIPSSIQNRFKQFHQNRNQSIQLNDSDEANLIKRDANSPFHKLDPSLMKLQTEQINRKKVKKSVNRDTKRKSLKTSIKNNKPYVHVFLSVSGSDFVAPEGFITRTVSPNGDIVSGYLDVEKMESVAKSSKIRKIEAVKFRKEHLKPALESIKADKIHQGLDGLPQAFQGEGVVVGIFDSGLDVRNQDFFDAESGSRVLYLLEYYEKETNDGYEYGSYEWTKNDIDNHIEEVTQIDGYGSGGHGTHVTGIAAGGGITNSDFKGVAPRADIIFVKGDRDPNGESGFADDDIIAGIEYIFDKADELEKAAVVNLSLGGLYGPRDGTSLFEQYITQLQGDGKIIVTAAGNEGFDYLHTGENVVRNKTYSIIEVPWDDISFDKEFWYDKGLINSYRVVAIDPNTNNQIVASSWYSVGTDNWDSEEGDRLFDLKEGYPAGFIYHESLELENEFNGDGMIYLYVYDGYNSDDDEDYAYIDDYYWLIQFKTNDSEGRVDAVNFYASSLPFNTNISGSEFIPGDLNQSVGSPATAHGVIAVGAYVTTTDWIADDESEFYVEYPRDFYWEESSPAQKGELAYFSSRGPTRDNRFVPHITAPGDLIFSVRSHDIDDEDLESDYLIESGNYYGMGGTSMSSPFVTGIVALLLQVKPDLNVDEIIQILSETALKDSFTGSESNYDWGYGKLDALAAIKKVINMTTSIEEREHLFSVELNQNYPNPFNPSTEISFSLSQSASVSLEVFDALGRKVMTLLDRKQFQGGMNTFRLDAKNLSSGFYLYRLNAQLTNGKTVTQSKTMLLIK